MTAPARALDHDEFVLKYVDGKDGETQTFCRSITFEHPTLPAPISFKQEPTGDERPEEMATSTEAVFPALRLWPIAHRLATHLCDHPELVRGKSVLELGSGVGLVGLVAAALGARSVAVTDANVSLLGENVEMSNLDNITVHKLIWGETEIAEEEPELILASDIIQNQGVEAMTELVATLKYFADKRAGPQEPLQFLVAYTIRMHWDTVNAFKDIAKTEGFEVSHVPTPEWNEEQMLFLLTFTGPQCNESTTGRDAVRL